MIYALPGGVSYFIVNRDDILSESHFTVIIISDDMIIQKAPRRSLYYSIEALSSLSTKDDIKIQ